MKIITISREFGSGGRELGKRLADQLEFAYYDREIITEIAGKNELDEGYVTSILERGISHKFPVTFGRTFSYSAAAQQNATKLLVAQQRIIKELAAQGNCVIVGRSANIILHEYNPLNLFVYADMNSKIQRCRDRATEGEILNDNELRKKIKQVDAGRARYHELLTNLKWGAKEGYHLCINTTNLQIKELTPFVANYVNYRFGGDIK